MSSDKIPTKKEKVTAVNDAVEDALLRSIGQIAIKPKKHTQEQIDAINRELAGLVTTSNLPGIASAVHNYTNSVLETSRTFLATQQQARLQDQKLTWEQRIEHRQALRKALETAAMEDHAEDLIAIGAPSHFTDAVSASKNKQNQASK